MRRRHFAVARHQDHDGRCVFGKKEYWDDLYGGNVDESSAGYRPADSYSWYCGHDELAPFWRALVPDRASRVVVAGVGNDATPAALYDDGWTNMVAYDYSRRGVDRARTLFGRGRDGIDLRVADARDLPLDDASVDATLDKGTLDAIYIAGQGAFRDAVREMGRVTAAGGVVVCVSSVVPPEELLGAFAAPLWGNVHDGTLAFAPDGEATIDLGAELFSWKRTAVPHCGAPVAVDDGAS